MYPVKNLIGVFPFVTSAILINAPHQIGVLKNEWKGRNNKMSQNKT